MACDMQCRELEYLGVLVAVREALGNPAGALSEMPNKVQEIFLARDAETATVKKLDDEANAWAKAVFAVAKASRIKNPVFGDVTRPDDVEILVSHVHQMAARNEDLENENEALRAAVAALRAKVRKLQRVRPKSALGRAFAAGKVKP